MVKASKTGVADAWTVFDALGNRVATKINDVWQFVIYDAFGKLVAEYGLPGEGRGGVSWVLQDWQGSVRASVNANGFIAARFDFNAFGEKISLGIGLRSIDQGYSAPTNARQGYGLTESDTATGLDHTWFRKNENRVGRWTSPDPYKGSMSLVSSGSFNRYSYTENQPTNFVDPSGLCTITYHYNAEGVLTGAVLSGDCAVTINGGGSRVMFGGGGFGSGGMFMTVESAGTEAPDSGGGFYEDHLQRVRNLQRRPITPPSRPKPPKDPCGQATDINVSYGNVNGSVIIGDHAIYVKGGVGVGVPGVGASMSLTNASPSEGLSLEGTLGAAIGGSRSVSANTPQQAMEFFNPSSESASASYGAMTPQASLSLNRTVRLFGLPKGKPECQK